MAKRVKYEVGDVFSLPIGEDEKTLGYGYGRILKKDKGILLIELYDIVTQERENMLEKLNHADWVLRIWSSSLGIKLGTWNIIGRIPIDPGFTMPDFWQSSCLVENKIFLYSGKNIETIHDLDHAPYRVITEAEIGNAQPKGLFGYIAAQIRYETQLKKRGLL